MYRRPKYRFKTESVFKISFHDTDAMGVVWHGNYIKFFELAREDMLNEIGYGYEDMQKDNVVFPIVECDCKFRNYIRVTDKRLRVVTMQTEFEGKVEMHYEVYADGSDKLCAYGYTKQVAMNMKTMELYFETPKSLLAAVNKFESEHGIK